MSKLALPKAPPLQSGDRMNRLEFERRYHAHPTDAKFELIDGVVFMASPVNYEYHASPHSNISGWLFLYRRRTPGVRCGDNGTLKLDSENEPQPDSLLLIEPTNGGQVRIDTDGYLNGSPELVVEVAASSVSLDANAKKRLYESSGAREYILWRVYDAVIEWFVNRAGMFELLTSPDGILRSEVFPGLWLDPAALLAEDIDRVEAALNQGLASPEHAAFVQRLQATRGATS